jgi:ABC-type sugar transport system ATPase subunit
LLIYERPASLAVARFVGSPAINLFEGTVALRGRVPVFDADGQTLAELPPAAAPLAGQPITLGVRPPDVELVPSDGVVGIVQAVEPVGPTQLVHVGLPGWQHLLAVLPSRPLVIAGSRGHFRFRPDRLHLFNQQGERYVAIDGVPSPARC